MWTGIVKGHVVSTMKHPSLLPAKMLIVRPVNPVSGAEEGLAQIAIDRMGAGRGQKVLVSGDGTGTQQILGADRSCPVRLAVVAILGDNDLRVSTPA